MSFREYRAALAREVADMCLRSAEMLMMPNINIMERVAKAWVWYNMLCLTGKCPEVGSDDPNQWSHEEVRKIAKALVKYAVDLLRIGVLTEELQPF